jgi:hypothetical protein
MLRVASMLHGRAAPTAAVSGSCVVVLTLTIIQATHMPPRVQMKEMRVAAGRPLLWMMRDVAAHAPGRHSRGTET